MSAPVTPAIFLGSVAALTAGAWAIAALVTQRRRRKLRALAVEWRMQYAPHDPFGLAGRIIRGFPVPGAAELRVSDVVYGAEGTCYRWIFIVEYTVGAIRRQRRLRRVGSFCEPKDAKAGPVAASQIEIAAHDLPLPDQYRAMRRRVMRQGQPSPQPA